MAEFVGIAIPQELKNLTLPSMAELNYWNLRQQRTFFIDYEIEDDYALIELSKEIIRINNEDKDIESPVPITLYIHSYGGDLRQAIFFCDLVEASHVPVITVATGAALSAGLLIFLAGKTRYAFKHTKVMLHQGQSSSSGTYEEMNITQKEFANEVRMTKEYILSHTKIFKETFEKNKSRDWYIYGKDLIKFGIADHIIEKLTDIK